MHCCAGQALHKLDPKHVASASIDLAWWPCCAQVKGLDPGVRDVFVTSSQPRYDRTLTPKENQSHYASFSGKRYHQESYHTFSQDKHKAWRANDATYQQVLSGIPTAKTASTVDMQVSCAPTPNSIVLITSAAAACCGCGLKLRRHTHTES